MAAAIKEKINSFEMYTIFRVCRMIAWPICNQCLKSIPQNFDVNMCTGFQIWQLSVM